MFDDTFNIAISGSRGFTDFWRFVGVLDSILKLDKTKSSIRLFEGGARGIDKLAVQYTVVRKVKHERFEADWDKFGKRAGILRNIEMIDASDMVIAFWDGSSKGTKHAIDYAIKKKKRCIIVRLDQNMKLEEVIPFTPFENRRMSDNLKDTSWGELVPLLSNEFQMAS